MILPCLAEARLGDYVWYMCNNNHHNNDNNNSIVVIIVIMIIVVILVFVSVPVSEGGMMRLETLIELKCMNSSFSSLSFC